MKKYKKTLTISFGILMIFGGIGHFVNPEMYNPFIPDFFNKEFINYMSGLAEITLGLGAFTSRFRTWATLGILLMMIGFLPLHILDIFKENPAIGNKTLAYIRLPIQFVLIYWAWFIYKK